MLAAGAHAQGTTLSAAAVPLAMSIANGAKIVYSSTGVPLASMVRTIATGPLSGSVLATEAGLLATPTGNAAIAVARTVTAAGVLGGAAAVAGAGMAGYAVGTAIMSYLGDSRLVFAPDGTLKLDSGANPSPVSVFCTAGTSSWGNRSHSNCGSSVTAAVAAWVSAENSLPEATAAQAVVRITGTCGAIRCDLERKTGPGGVFNWWQQLGAEETSQLACPAYVDFFNPAYSTAAGSAPMADGKCRAGLYTVVDPATAATVVSNYGQPTQAPNVVRDLLAQGAQFPATAPDVTGPGTVTNPVPKVTTTTTPGGAVSTSTTYNTTNITYQGDTISYVSTTNTINPDGSTTTTTAAEPVETCGLPGKPACKIDETGTPTVALESQTAKANSIFEGITNCVTTPSSCLPALPSLNWGFTFPSSCGPIALPGFGAWLEAIDICPWQPMIHDIMSLIWAATGLFGMVGMMFKGSE